MKETYTFFNQESIFTNGKTKWLYLTIFRAHLFKTGFIFDRLSKYKRNINLKKVCLLRETLCDTNPLKHRNFRGKCISPFLYIFFALLSCVYILWKHAVLCAYMFQYRVNEKVCSSGKCARPPQICKTCFVQFANCPPDCSFQVGWNGLFISSAFCELALLV